MEKGSSNQLWKRVGLFEVVTEVVEGARGELQRIPGELTFMESGCVPDANIYSLKKGQVICRIHVRIYHGVQTNRLRFHTHALVVANDEADQVRTHQWRISESNQHKNGMKLRLRKGKRTIAHETVLVLSLSTLVEIAGMLLSAIMEAGKVSVMENTLLIAGSSQHGNAIRASVITK